MLSTTLLISSSLLLAYFLKMILSSWITDHRNSSLIPTSTSTSTSTTPPTTLSPGARPRTTLLHLPPELRLQIYSLVLPTSNAFIVGRDYGHRVARLSPPPLLQTCRQLRLETTPLFYGSNTFIVDVHTLKDLTAFLGWMRGGGLDWRFVADLQDLRITVAGALLVDVVWGDGRRKHDRVVATKSRLDYTMQWDRQNILHYTHDFRLAKPRIESLLQHVRVNSTGGSGLTLALLVDLVRLIFKVERLDDATRALFISVDTQVMIKNRFASGDW